MKGLRSLKSGEVFPASPTLIEWINLPDNLRKAYTIKRNKHLSTKNSEAPIFDKRLRPYQNQDVNFLIQLKRGKGVFNQQRTGKTPTTLVTMRELNQQNNIIIVPKSAIFSWRREFKKWHQGELLQIKRWWSKTRRLEELEKLRGKKGTLIINYHKAKIDLDLIISVLSPFDAVILDEAHVMRNYRGLSSRNKIIETKTGTKTIKKYKSPEIANAIIRLRRHSKDAYALTGTPTSSRVEDIFGILAFIHPDLFTSFWGFANYFMKQIPNKLWDPINKQLNTTFTLSGFLNSAKEKELLEYLETFSIQRKRIDIMQWIPQVDYEVIEFEPSIKMLKWHKELKEYFETEDVICENTLTVMLRLRQLTTCPQMLGMPEIGPKFEYLLDYIDDYPNKPIILTGFFTSALKILHELLKKQGHKQIETMFGETTAKNRERIKEAFLAKEFTILIGNIQVIKESLDLSIAEEIIIIDPSLTCSDNEQVADRFIPPTEIQAMTKNGQLIKRLNILKTIDVYIHSQLNAKAKEIDIINNYTNKLKKKERKNVK